MLDTTTGTSTPTRRWSGMSSSRMSSAQRKGESPSPSPASTSDRCTICLEHNAAVTLKPCGHNAFCIACTAFVEASTCPLCRVHITDLCLPHASTSLSMSSLHQERLVRNNFYRRATPQIVILTPAILDSASRAMVEHLKRMFPCPPPEHTLLCHLPYVSPHAPNTTVNGVPAKFSIVRATHPPVLMTLGEIINSRPKFLLLVCPAHDGAALNRMLIWDRLLRPMTARGLFRIWIFIAEPSSKPWIRLNDIPFRNNMMKVVTNIPRSERPVGFYVLRPTGSRSSGVIRDIAERSVRHASRVRVNTPPET